MAYDPEGYFLEFETFLDHPQNTSLRKLLESKETLYPQEDQVTQRPPTLGIQANVIWLYYKDIPAAQQFYNEIFGSELLVDQGFAKVYSSSPTAFIGLVDEAQGLHWFSEEKAVTISFITEQINEWYEYLTSKNLEMRTSEILVENDAVEVFVTYDVGGYFLEFDRFLEHEKNVNLLESLNSTY